MDLVHLVLGLATIFALIVFLLDRQTEYLPEYLGVSGPIILIRSQVGFGLVERISSYRKVWKRIGTFGIVICFIGMVLAVFGIGTSAASVLLRPSETQITQPTNYLAIPGVNDFLPLSVAVEILLALVVGVVLHEGAHAVLCRVEDIDLDSTGLVFLSFIPMGAFVEPIEESKDAATRIGRMRMASAGILSNLGLTLISVVAVVIIASTLITAVQGGAVGGVYDSSPASESSLEAGQVIVSINGESIESNDELETYLETSTATTLSIQTNDGETHTINRNVFVSGVQNEIIPIGTDVVSVNGEEIQTVAGMKEAIGSSEIIQLQSSSGESYTAPAGGQVQVETSNGKQIVYVTSVGGTQTLTGESVARELSSSSQEVVYYTVSEDGFSRETGTLSESAIVEVYSGVAGVEFKDTGVTTYPAEQFLSVLQFSDDISLFQGAVLWFVLPLGQMIPGISFNFPGFTEVNMNFYEVTLGFGEPVVFFVVTAFFWMAWMNFNLALFNCLPIWALDGNHVLRDGLREVNDRFEKPKLTLKALEYGIPFVTLLMFLVILFAPFIISYL